MIKGFTDEDVTDQTGKTVFITGANTGIGFEAAKVLAGKGARVLLGCRSPEKADDAKARIADEHPEAEVEVVEIDLADLASVRRAAERVAQEPRLDVLVNNAGVMFPPRQLTKDGFELQLGVNHLGHFALAGHLIDKLERTEGSRIVIVSSNAHKGAKIIFDDLNAERSYNKLERYSMSKLANLLHMYELDRRLRAKGSGTIAAAAHPGGSDTDLWRHLPQWARPLMPLARPFINSSAQGAWPTLLAATAGGVEGGQYFGPARFFEVVGPARQVDSSARSKDPELAQKLWDLSIELTGVDPEI